MHVHVDLHARTRAGSSWGVQPAGVGRSRQRACGRPGRPKPYEARVWRGGKQVRLATSPAKEAGPRRVATVAHLVVVDHGLLVLGGLEGLVALRLELQRLGDVRLRVRGHQAGQVGCGQWLGSTIRVSRSAPRGFTKATPTPAAKKADQPSNPNRPGVRGVRDRPTDSWAAR